MKFKIHKKFDDSCLNLIFSLDCKNKIKFHDSVNVHFNLFSKISTSVQKNEIPACSVRNSKDLMKKLF